MNSAVSWKVLFHKEKQNKTKQNKTKTNNNKTLWLLTPLLGNNIQACRYFEDIEAFSSVTIIWIPFKTKSTI